ncbi:putative glycerol-3-phosphate transporter 5 [Thelohanellus kitauei]|uniref:Putative glycerol-3-phosphate transporter 5 n=1 Tax=Thelohanellus kitauei TaxID=669202 RepID=A0A0C2JAQ2_THEKT|nr:putative glycerol-3-phosphate transporter 5 [Thelohanellus kitauei]
MVLFGMGDFFHVHYLPFYLTLQVNKNTNQILSGIFQSAGWPCVISIVSSWVPKAAMGSILGIWGNHYAVGNILGQTLSSLFVNYHWGMAFITNGVLCIATAVIVALFLVSKPENMGFERENEPESLTPMIGVLEFAFSLFFCKIVIFTFLFWLPFYIKSTGIDDYEVSPSTAGYLASLFDVGGIFGNIMTGIVLDVVKKGGCLCLVLHILSSVSLFLFAKFGSECFSTCVILLLTTGFFVNSPQTLINGTISASLV